MGIPQSNEVIMADFSQNEVDKLIIKSLEPKFLNELITQGAKKVNLEEMLNKSSRIILKVPTLLLSGTFLNLDNIGNNFFEGNFFKCCLYNFRGYSCEVQKTNLPITIRNINSGDVWWLENKNYYILRLSNGYNIN